MPLTSTQDVIVRLCQRLPVPAFKFLRDVKIVWRKKLIQPHESLCSMLRHCITGFAGVFQFLDGSDQEVIEDLRVCKEYLQPISKILNEARSNMSKCCFIKRGLYFRTCLKKRRKNMSTRNHAYWASWSSVSRFTMLKSRNKETKSNSSKHRCKVSERKALWQCIKNGVRYECLFWRTTRARFSK